MITGKKRKKMKFQKKANILLGIVGTCGLATTGVGVGLRLAFLYVGAGCIFYLYLFGMMLIFVAQALSRFQLQTTTDAVLLQPGIFTLAMGGGLQLAFNGVADSNYDWILVTGTAVLAVCMVAYGMGTVYFDENPAKKDAD